MTELLKAIEAMSETVCLAEAIGDAFESISGEACPPPWVYVYRRQLEAIRAASEAVELLARRGET